MMYLSDVEWNMKVMCPKCDNLGLNKKYITKTEYCYWCPNCEDQIAREAVKFIHHHDKA